MIEEDINERIARLAPSQNIAERQLKPAAIDAIAALPQDPTAQLAPMEQGQYGLNAAQDVLIKSLPSANDTAMKSSLMAARTVSPDQAARARKAATQAGVGTDIALRNLDEIERRAYMRDIDRMEIARRDPALAEFLRDRDNAMLAQDDIANLRETKSLYDTIIEYPRELMRDATIGVAAGMMDFRASMYAYNLRDRDSISETERSQMLGMFSLSEAIYNTRQPGFVTSAARVVGQQVEPMQQAVGRGAQTGLVFGGAAAVGGQIGPQALLPEELVTVPGAMTFGFSAGMTSSLVETSFKQLAGYSYAEMMRENIPQRQAYWVSGVAGSINAGLELGGLALVTRPFRQVIAKAIARKVADELTQATTKQIATTAAKEYLIGGAGEVAVEVTQEVVDAVAVSAAQYIDQYGLPSSERNVKLMTAQGWEELVDKSVKVGIETAKAMAILGVAGPFVKGTYTVVQMDKARKQAKFMEQAIELASRSKLRERDPVAYRNLLEQRAQATPAENVYIDANIMDGILRKQGITAADMDAVIPDFSARLADAQASNSSIRLSSAEFIAQLSQSEVGRAMAQHLRVGDPNAMSMFDVAQGEAMRQAMLEQSRAAMEARTEADRTFVDSANRVEDSITEMLRETGKLTPDQVTATAEVMSAFVVVQAAEAKQTPEEFWARWRNQIVGPQAAPAMAGMEQAAQFDLTGQRRLDTPQFKQWFRESKAVDRKGMPLMLYHGTEAAEDFAVFEPGGGFFARGIYLSPRPNVAGEYAGTGTGARIMPLYASIQNPFVVESDTTFEQAVSRETGVAVTEETSPDTITELLRSKGYDGVYVRADDVWVAFDPQQVKSVNNRGTWTGEAMLEQQQIASLDAAHAAAEKAGDIAAGERLTKQAAMAAGLTETVYRGDQQPGITEYAPERRTEPGIFTTYTRSVAQEFYAGEEGARKFYVGGKTLDLSWESREAVKWIREWARESGFDFIDRASGQPIDPVEAVMSGRMFDFEGDWSGARWKDIQRTAKAQGYDIVKLRDSGDDIITSVVVLNENNIKLADPFTYDAQGNLIPLSKRFNLQSRSVLEQQPVAPPPDAGIFDVNNPPAPTSARYEREGGGPVVALMDYDGNVYYDRNASMHGDLLDTFPELEADMVIDGGFIIDGKYRPGMSDGGFAAGEAGPEMVQRVRELTERVNTPTRLAQKPVAQPGPIEAAKALVAQSGRETFTDADEFFKKRWASLLKRTKRTVKPVPSNFREAARRAVNDMLDFVKDNPKFADYYEKDWALTRKILDDYIGRPITNDEFAMFRVIAGLTSPNTLLSSNISDTVGLWNHWMEFRNFDAFTLGPKPGTGALVLFEAAEPISGTTANVKLRTIQIIEQLVKDKGSVTDALAFLQEGVPVSQLHKFNRRMGYSGAVGDIGNITSLVKQATGQDKLIPRMFIFGQKVGAYTLNAVGDSRYTTVDIWESRYIRSHFTGMFEANIGLPETTDEHRIFTRFGELFNEEMERVTGRNWAPSALQALRWFYIIETARNAGYSKASTNETISFYTERKLAQSFGYRGLGAAGRQPGAGAVAAGAGAGQVSAARIPPKRFERDLAKDVEGIEDARERKRRIAAGYVGYARYNSERGRADFRFDERRLGSPRPHGVLIDAQVVADYVPGAQMVRAYGKAGLPTATIHELGTDAASAQAFRDLVLSTNEQNQYGAAVYAYSAEEYQGKRLFVTEDGTAGFALSPDGDIVSVFSAPKSGNGRSLMALSVQVGGTKLDCFDTALPGYYAAHGFRAVARLPWSDQYAPAGWDKQVFAQYNNGEPAVVFMVYQPGYMGAYKAGAGATVASYDDGVAAQAKAIEAERRATSLFQDARGTFDPETFVTRLGQAGDISTVAHETAHYWLEVMGRIAGDSGAPARIVEDLDRVLQWFGIAGASPAERIAKWNGMSLEEKRKHHEAFALNFELYLFEGKAPSIELQGVFDKFKRWLMVVYKQIRDQLNVQYKQQFGRDLPVMTGEVRQVMDRLLATDEQIKRAQAMRDMMGDFETQEQSGLNDAEWDAYQSLRNEATDEAAREHAKASLRQMQWLSNAKSKMLKDMQARHKKMRDRMREEVSNAVRKERVYRAIDFLRRGRWINEEGNEETTTTHKLDAAAVQRMYEMEPENLRPDLAKLGKGKYGMLAKEGGMDPELAAEALGYASADEMIRAVIDARPIAEVIDERTDARMLAESGELATPQSREEAIDRALHNEARGRFIAVELRLHSKATQPANSMRQAARQVAKQVISGRRIRDIRPREYVAAESRAARDAANALRDLPDPKVAGQAAFTRSMTEQASAIAAGMPISDAQAIAEAARQDATRKAQERVDAYREKYPDADPAQVVIAAKRNQLLNNQMAAEATAVRDEIETALEKFRRLFRPDEKIAKGRDMNLVNAGRAVLAYYGLGRSDKSPAEYLEQMRSYDPELYEELRPLIERAARGPQDYRNLTVDEFRIMRDAVEAFWYGSRRRNQIKVEGKLVDLETATSALVERLEEIGVPEVVPGERRAPTAKDRAVRALNTLKAIMTRVEHWAWRTDGPDDVRAFTTYIWRPVKDALVAYRLDRNTYVKRFVDLLGTITIPEGKIDAQELNYTFGYGNGGLGKAEVLGAMMHMGNESNLRKLLLGRGWGELDADGNLVTARWDAFVTRMFAEGVVTKADMDFLQAVWDLNEEIKPLAQKAHYELFGYYFQEVGASPIVTPFGEYRGGYVPAKTDSFMVADARSNEAMEELESDFRQSMPSTGRGFTRSRTEYNRPLSLDLRLMAQHIDSVVRFANVQPAIRDVLRILRAPAFRDALNRADPGAINDMLLPWLTRAARQVTMEPGMFKLTDKFWTAVRSRIGSSIMFANLRNALQQLTGAFPAMLRVDPGYFKSALATYIGSPFKVADEVASMSPYMANRMRSQMFELQESMNDIMLNPSKYERIQQWSNKHGYFLQTAHQNIVDIVTWTGAYNQSLAQSGLQASDPVAQREAIAAGDAAVRMTQGSMDPEDVSRVEVGSPFYRTFVQFTGYFNMLANLNSSEYIRVIRDLGWRSNKGRLVYIYVMGFMLPTIVADAIVRTLGGQWDDEDEDGYLDVMMSWFFGSQIRAGAAMIPFGGVGLQLATGGFTSAPYDDRISASPSLAALERATVGTTKAVIALIDPDKDVSGKNVRDVLTLLSLFTGIPAEVIGRPVGYAIDVKRGEVEPTGMWDYIRGLVTGAASPESKR